LSEHLDTILSKITEAGGDRNLICSKTREQEPKTWRQIAMWYARANQLGTWKSIGIYFNRDHSTVINAVNYINDLIESNDSEVISKLEKIGINHNNIIIYYFSKCVNHTFHVVFIFLLIFFHIFSLYKI
jgi:hypothetical protein